MNKETFELQLKDRLAMSTDVFWDALTDYVNHAQRLVAAITRGVPEEISGTISVDSYSISLPDKVVGIYDDGFYTSTGRSLKVIGNKEIQRKMPNWRRVYGNPRWAVVDMKNRLVYAIPIGGTDTSLIDESDELLLDEDGAQLIFNQGYTLTGSVAVLPDDVVNNTDNLFNDERSMDKYLNATLLLASSIALLKERYDGDAERFFQFFNQELQMLGIDPERIPDIQEASRDVNMDNPNAAR